MASFQDAAVLSCLDRLGKSCGDIGHAAEQAKGTIGELASDYSMVWSPIPDYDWDSLPLSSSISILRAWMNRCRNNITAATTINP
jgi:hypothetical protein